jgi:septal ring-binding cell division protein DamX
MAKQRKAKAEPDWKHLVSAGALVTAVLGTLLLGAVLQADPERREPASASLPSGLTPEPEEPRTEGISESARADDREGPSTTSGYAVPFGGDAGLADRAAADERRLDASGHGYTLQFAVNCETKNVRANLEALKGHHDFYLLTMLYQDRACFRLCWGFYNSEQQALAARDVPETLRAMSTNPKVLSIAEALP